MRLKRGVALSELSASSEPEAEPELEPDLLFPAGAIIASAMAAAAICPIIRGSFTAYSAKRPDQHRRVITRSGDARAIRRKRDHLHAAVVSDQGECVLELLGIEDFRRHFDRLGSGEKLPPPLTD